MGINYFPLCRFRATLYECPPTSAKRREMSMAVSGRINDLTTVCRCIHLWHTHQSMLLPTLNDQVYLRAVISSFYALFSGVATDKRSQCDSA